MRVFAKVIIKKRTKKSLSDIAHSLLDLVFRRKKLCLWYKFFYLNQQKLSLILFLSLQSDNQIIVSVAKKVINCLCCVVYCILICNPLPEISLHLIAPLILIARHIFSNQRLFMNSANWNIKCLIIWIINTKKNYTQENIKCNCLKFQFFPLSKDNQTT